MLIHRRKDTKETIAVITTNREDLAFYNKVAPEGTEYVKAEDIRKSEGKTPKPKPVVKKTKKKGNK